MFRLLTEWLPLIAFFAAYKIYGMVPATGVLIVGTIASVIAVYIKHRKVPVALWLPALLVSVFGGLTIISDNDMFIKIKPTIVYCLFAAILLGGVIKGKGFLKHLLGSAIDMEEKSWLKFSARWGVFFIFMAIANEIVWRNFSTDIWVDFKVFGAIPLTFLFLLTQMPFLKGNSTLLDKEDKSK